MKISSVEIPGFLNCQMYWHWTRGKFVDADWDYITVDYPFVKITYTTYGIV
jgi:hypothetical protein